ncbi:MAG TPA: hypothetical protein EYP04_00385 [Anaerolineae bacterium]|nr:hypothetical protein [Anaerolineae bacterium]
MMQKRKRTFLSGLQWRLTFYYAMAMLAALLILEILAMLGVFWVSKHSGLPLHLVSSVTEGVALEADVFLSAQPPDLARLQTWLESRVPLRENGCGFPGLYAGNYLAKATATNLPSRYDLAVIVSTDGRLLAANVPTSLQEEWQTAPFLDPIAPGVNQQLWSSALDGVPETTRLSDGTIASAQPVRNNSGTVVSAVYMRVVSMSPGGRSFQMALRVLGAIALTLAVARIILATLRGDLRRPVGLLRPDCHCDSPSPLRAAGIALRCTLLVSRY